MKIILADDDPDVRRSAVRLLEALNHEVTEVESGEDLLIELNASKFDLAITDGQMGPDGLNGLKVLYLIRHHVHFESLPVIVYTGSDIREAVEAGDGIFVSKSDSLLEAIRQIEAELNKKG